MCERIHRTGQGERGFDLRTNLIYSNIKEIKHKIQLFLKNTQYYSYVCFIHIYEK